MRYSNVVMFIKFSLFGLSWSACCWNLINYVAWFFLMNSSFGSQDLKKIETFAFWARKMRSNKMNFTEKSNGLVCWACQRSKGVSFHPHIDEVRAVEYYQVLNTYIWSKPPKFPQNSVVQREGVSQQIKLFSVLFLVNCFRTPDWRTRSQTLLHRNFPLGFVKHQVFWTSVPSLSRLRQGIVTALKTVSRKHSKKFR